jgi:hypothetical protein
VHWWVLLVHSSPILEEGLGINPGSEFFKGVKALILYFLRSISYPNKM